MYSCVGTVRHRAMQPPRGGTVAVCSALLQSSPALHPKTAARLLIRHARFPRLISLPAFLACLLQVQALRSVEKYLGLEKLYVLGTNCTDK